MTDADRNEAGAPEDRLVGILDQIHVALLAADYAGLAPLTAGLETEIAVLEEGRDVEALARVQVRARRNEACLQAAQRGLRAARRRVAEIAAARSGLVTYDTKGRRAEQHPTFELAKRF